MSASSAPKIAVYDLDRTILRRPTFTYFLFWAARHYKPWRLLLTPIWLVLALGYVLKFYDRNFFKPACITLFLGRRLPAAWMANVAQAFAQSRVPFDVQAGAKAAIARDRAEGYLLVMATAAPEIYAPAIGAALGFDAVIATRHVRQANGDWSAALAGPNCYGAEKARRVAEWLTEKGWNKPAHMRAYSDHHSDAPLFDMSDEATLVADGEKAAALATQHGWTLDNFRA